MAREFESVLPVAAFVVRLRCGFDKSHFPSASSSALKTLARAELQQLFSSICSGAAVASSQGTGK